MILSLNWLFQRLTGAVLFMGLGLHFYIMHFAGADALGVQAVLERLASPSWRAFNAAFLLSAIYHGFSGLWGIAVEYINEGAMLRAAKAFVLASAIGLGAAGLYILSLG